MARFGGGVSWKFYLAIYFFIILWTAVTCLKLFLDLLRHPILFFKRTKRVTPPDCMHRYVEANGIKFHCVACGDPSKPLMLLLHGFPEVSTLKS